MISRKLITAIKSRYTLNWHGIHGITHWGRVYENGLFLAGETGALLPVVELFAVFHDSCRLSDGRDNAHGPRGAQLAEELRGLYFDLADADFSLLLTACSRHTIALTDDDITVQTCFDADRLDLARVGKTPDPDQLCTEMARRPETIAWANNRSTSNAIAEILAVWGE